MRVDDLGCDLGAPVTRPVTRVVSLVPSLTESLATVNPTALVGITDWCTHPDGLAAGGAVRVRGTKNPDVQQICSLAPELVVANQEENRRTDVERLRAAGVPVWVTRTESVAEALISLRRLFTTGLGWPVPAWLEESEKEWAGPVPVGRVRAVVPVWRDPWMVVGRPTFTADLLGRCGVEVHPVVEGRYPSVGLPELRSSGADLVLLPDEPYAFSSNDGPEAFRDTGIAVGLVSGRHLTWYGPSLLEAREVVVKAVEAARPVD